MSSTNERKAKAGTGALDRLLRIGFVVAGLTVVFMAGSVFTLAEVFPGPVISDAYKGGRALYRKLADYDDPFKTDLWQEARTTKAGVTVHDPDRVQEGVTLYTSGDEAAAYLISADGRVVHKWQRPFSTVWNENATAAHPEAVQDPQPDRNVYFRKVHAFPNGDLLALYEGVGDSPYGYGLVKLDRDSNVLWTYFGRAHHDFDVAADGRIYVLTHRISRDVLPGLEYLDSPRIDDSLVVLSPDGEELKTIDLIRAVAESRYKSLLYDTTAFGDPLHANDVDLIDAPTAERFPFAREGQVALSFRELHAVVVLDLDNAETVWATRGPWIGQHDIDLLDNGRLMLFDNRGRFDVAGGRSRVIEFDPQTMEIVWRYEGTPERPFDSGIRSSQQRLANGNTLITESDGGRILEVSPEGDIVWEFINPVRAGPNGKYIPIVNSARRVDAPWLDAKQARLD